jgi:pyrimidine deaminase RibD-like protein
VKAQERKFMEAAIEAARTSPADVTGAIPRVGAVAVQGDRIIGVAHRGQNPLKPGDHAEYILLDQLLVNTSLVNATIYTTLEPCTKRGPEKIPCVERLIKRKVARVVIGMLDPNPIIRGLGFRKLRLANIPTDVFPHDFMSQVEDINRDFIHAIENHPVHRMTQEIAVLAVRANEDRQRNAVDRTLACCLHELRRIENGEIAIPGREAGYFRHWLDKVTNFQGTEHVKAYIRLSAFNPEELHSKNWFQEFYQRLSEMVKSGKLTIRYVFLLRSKEPTDATGQYLNLIKDFAEEIRFIGHEGHHLPPDELRPSIVLFENQRAAFTHDRADTTALLKASEWIFKKDYDRLSKQFSIIELASNVYFRRNAT